jgi:hypothetical protein
MDDALKCILDVYDVAQCLISIWIIPRRQQHAAVCRIKLHTWRQTGYSVILMSLLLHTIANSFSFEYFMLGFRHSLMQCNNNKIKQRSYCPTFMLSSSAIYSPIRIVYQSPSNSNFGHIVVIELSRCCWILWLDVPIGKWQQQLLLCTVLMFFGWILLLVCHMTISSTTTNELPGIWPGFYTVLSKCRMK